MAVGFGEEHGLNESYLEGAQIAPKLKLVSVDWIEDPKFTHGVIEFQGEGGKTQLKISPPNPKKPFANKTMAETKTFLEKKFSTICQHVAKVTGIYNDLPKTALTYKQMILLLKEKLAPIIANGNQLYWVKISKNSNGYAEVSSETPCIEKYVENMPHSLAWTPYDRKMNAIVRVANSTASVDDEENNTNASTEESGNPFAPESNMSAGMPFDTDDI